MTTRPTAKSKSSPQNDDPRFFGPPPLMPGDDAKAYEALRAAISTDMAPLDSLDQIWTRDITDLQWEVIRLRRLKIEAIKARMREALKFRLIAGMIGDDDDEAAEPNFFAEPNLDEEAELAASVFAININLISKFDHLIASAEARRNTA